MFLEDLAIEYSKTHQRATCRICKVRIDLGEVRIGEETLVDEDENVILFWKHLRCFSLGKKYKDVDPTKIKGYEQLREPDQRRVKTHFESGGYKPVKAVKPKKKKAATSKRQKSRQRRDSHNSEEDEEQEDIIQQNEEDDSDEQSTSSAQVSNRSSRSQVQKRQSSQSTKPSTNNKEKENKNKRRNALVLLGYTYEQLDKYLVIIEKIKDETEETLKSWLLFNDQSAFGNKETLSHRCADAMLLGAIQKCPTCKKSNMDFSFSDGVYKCLGRLPGTCGKKHESQGIERKVWKKQDTVPEDVKGEQQE